MGGQPQHDGVPEVQVLGLRKSNLGVRRPYIIGQRVRSSMEPDLGLGRVEALEERNIRVHFPGPDEVRLYDASDAPLVQLQLQTGSTLSGQDGQVTIEEVKEEDGLLHYKTSEGWTAETDLPAFIDAQGPRDQILEGSWDRPNLLDLRMEALWAENHLRSNPTLGLQGGRIRLYPHQLDLARELCDRPMVRTMLADEVGLGKTIEALLIANRLLLSERIHRILIVVPDSLVHQWFAEAWIRFNLPFRLLDEGFLENLEDEEQGLLSQSRVICTLDQLNLSDFSSEDWDLLIVDEVHKIHSDCEDGQRISKLCQTSPHVLLLSATPADLDSEEHFTKLSWLEPEVYHDLDLYREQQSRNIEVGQLFSELGEGVVPSSEKLTSLLPTRFSVDTSDQEELLRSVLSLHGPAYHLVKHTRKTVEGFPLRRVQLIPLQGDPKRLKKEWLHEQGDEVAFRYQGMDRDPRVQWMVEALKLHPDRKFLVLAESRLKVEATVKGLENLGVKHIARFHEGQSLLERDRQAAWFTEDDGPPILISSNLGAEGRNFQSASHLILLDINTDPALLEQRIGRLDRIGQDRDIDIHLPYVEGSPQAALFRWHHESFHAFENPWCGVDAIHREIGPKLAGMLRENTIDDKAFTELILETQKEHKRLIEELEVNRDHLLEACWHHPDRSHQLEADVVREDQDASLENFMQMAWELSGIDAIPLGKRSYRLKANDGYGQPFPGFREKGMSVTFHRPKALKRDDITFLSWDHPMVRDTVQLLSTGELGRTSVVEIRTPKPNLLIDICYRVHHQCEHQLQADRFFPPVPVKIAMDRDGRPINLKREVLKEKWHHLKKLPLPPEELRLWLDDKLSRGKTMAEEQAQKISTSAQEKHHLEERRYRSRIQGLIELNPSIKSDELEKYSSKQEMIKEGLSQPVVELDSIRLIVCRPN